MNQFYIAEMSIRYYLFATDRSLRRSLLETMDSYGPHLTTAVIEEQISPQLQVGAGGGGRGGIGAGGEVNG